MLGQYFYNETIRNTIIAFGSLFNDIYCTRKDSAGTAFIIRLEGDPNLDQKVAITLPRIGFEINGLDYAPERKLNRIMKKRKVQNTEDDKLKSMLTQYSPVPWNIGFELFVMARNSDDGIQIVEQILPFFQPEYTVSIREVPEMDTIRDVPIILNSVSYEDTYEGDFTTRRAIVYTFNFTAKTYVYGPVISSKQITKAEVKTYANLQDAAPDRVQKITTTVSSAPDADDNFGFNETTSEWV